MATRGASTDYIEHPGTGRTRSLTTSQRPRVLYVDDEPASLRIFKNTFRTLFEVYVAGSVDEAIASLNEAPVDIIITDLRMPGKDGLVLLKHAKATYPNTKLILLTGYADMSALEEAINDIGIYRYVAKPWQQEDLQQIIENALQVLRLEKENKESQELLAISNERLALAISAAKMGMWDWHIYNRTLFMSDEYYRILGYEPREFEPTPDSWMNLSTDEDRERMAEEYRDYLANWKNESDLLRVSVRLLKKSKEPVWVEVWGKVVAVNGEGLPERLVGTTRDITDEKLRKEREIGLVLSTEDKERNRIAMELHDGIGQNLTATHMFFEGLKKNIQDQDEQAQEMYTQGMNFLNMAIDESRDMAYNLMPKAIKDFGYTIAVNNLINKLQGASSTELNFYSNLGDERLDHHVELGLFRITQEALNNVIKHSNASKAFVQLLISDTGIVLTVEDNGKGFDAVEKKKAESMGLTSISNRVAALSGIVTLDSSPGNGTNYTIEIPLNK